MSIGVSNSMFSNLSENSVSYSLSFFRDNDNYINEFNKRIDVQSDLFNANLFYVHKGCYEFSTHLTGLAGH